jgi:uncharacterized protein YwqG
MQRTLGDILLNANKVRRLGSMNEDIKQVVTRNLTLFKRIGWKPVTVDGDTGLTSSKFSGTPYLKDGEKWPLCPNCGKPMQLFIQLNIEELPSDFRNYLQMDHGLLQMFYCTNSDPICEVDCEAYFPFSNSTLLRVIEPSEVTNRVDLPQGDFFPPKTIVEWEHFDDYPNCDELRELGVQLNHEEEEVLWDGIGPSNGDKLGGWPYWVQNIEYPSCPICQKSMRLIFQIDSEDNIPYMFGDVGCGHITQCPEHKEVLAFGWACC